MIRYIRSLLIAAALLTAAGCGLGAGGDPAIVDFEPGPNGPPPAPRLYRDQVGKLHDRLLDNQSCDWFIPTVYCDRRCFPDPPLLEACGVDGKKYYSFGKGDLTVIRRFGTKMIEKDSTCGGKTAHQLLELTAVSMGQLPAQILDCKTAKDFSLKPAADRIWYLGTVSNIRPASVYELPVM